MQWGTWLTIFYPFPVMPILGKTSKAYALFIFSIIKVQRVADKLGLDVEVRNIENPRMELEEHYYNPDHQLTHPQSTQKRVNPDFDSKLVRR